MTFEEQLETVAKALIENQRRLCFKAGPKAQPVILIIGAAGSGENKLPLGKQAFEIFKKDFISTGGLNREGSADEKEFRRAVFEKALNRLSIAYNLPEGDFETQLSVLNSMELYGLREKLQLVYGCRYGANLTYELIAHLLKHRYIDAVVNFNFDELLDQAIEDELSKNEYYNIVYDGDCPGALLQKDRFVHQGYKVDLPVYIKPHGTASHWNSLRFTREQYYTTAPDILQVLANLFLGETKPDGSTNRPITVITVGFNGESIELRQILKKNKQISYFHIKRTPPRPVIDTESEVTIVPPEERIPLVFKKLCQCIKDLQRAEKYEARGIYRHLLLNRIFFREYISGSIPETREALRPETLSWLHDRVLVEILLAIAKARGFLTISQLAEDRSGRYYSTLLNHHRQFAVAEEKKSVNLEKSGEYPGRELDSFSQMCRNLHLFNASLAGESLIFTEVEPTTPTDNASVVGWEQFEKNMLQVLEKLPRMLNNSLVRDNFLKLPKRMFLETCDKLYHGDETEVYTRKDSVCDKLFAKPFSIQNEYALSHYTHEIISRSISSLYVVAETANWLLKPRYRSLLEHNVVDKLVILVADDSRALNIYDAFGADRVAIFRMLWWEHNRHMTIPLTPGEEIQAIYMARRLRYSHISPLLLTGLDADFAIRMFCDYLTRIKFYQEPKTNRAIIIDEKWIKGHGFRMTQNRIEISREIDAFVKSILENVSKTK